MPVNSPDDRHGGERDVTMGDVLRLEWLQAQPKWEIPIESIRCTMRHVDPIVIWHFVAYQTVERFP